MTKKQKNRKMIHQNLRNKVLNRKYSSLMKFFFKKLKVKLGLLHKKLDMNLNDRLEIFCLQKKLDSIIDKSVKRNVIHKNKSSRKKSQIAKIIKKAFNFTLNGVLQNSNF